MNGPVNVLVVSLESIGASAHHFGNHLRVRSGLDGASHENMAQIIRPDSPADPRPFDGPLPGTLNILDRFPVIVDDRAVLSVGFPPGF